MSQHSDVELTSTLQALAGGDATRADELLPLVYSELHSLADKLLKREQPGVTLQPTALVHEAFLKLVDQTRIDWKGKTHFFALGATTMRRILVDHARNRKRLKRGGGWQRVAFDVASELSAKDDDDILAVDEALEKLHSIDPIQAKIVELRFFGGLTVADVAEVLKMSKRTVESEWQVTRAWLRRELSSTKSK